MANIDNGNGFFYVKHWLEIHNLEMAEALNTYSDLDISDVEYDKI